MRGASLRCRARARRSWCRAGRSRTRRRAAPRPPRRSRRSGTGCTSLGRDHAGLDQQVEVDQPGPELAPEEQDRPHPRLAGLHQRQHLEQLVERAEAAGEADQGDRAHQEVHLAQREVVELEAELGRDVAVGHLLVREHDVEADALAADLERAAVAGFHDAGAAAGDDVDRLGERRRAARDDRREAARLVVVARHRDARLGDLAAPAASPARARRRELALGDLGRRRCGRCRR